MHGTNLGLRALLISIALAALVAGCSNYRGEWPRLAPADAGDLAFQENPEATIAGAAGVGANAARPPLGSPPSAAPPRALNLLVADVAETAAAFDKLMARYDNQRGRLQEAFKTVLPGRIDAWRDAQFELSRLNQIVTEMREERRALGRTAADLASLAAAETDVGQSLRAAGALIGRIDGAILAADSFIVTVSRSLERQRSGLV